MTRFDLVFRIFCISLLFSKTLAIETDRRVLKFVRNGRTACSGDEGAHGTCTSRLSCSKMRGTPSGLCGLFGTCCVLSSCEIGTDSKTAVFTNPPFTAQDEDGDCSYDVDVNNARVCQMRIDFETFTLAQPTSGTASPGTDVSGYECRDDRLRITGNVPGDAIPALCGENAGQHVYVRVDASSRANGIRLNFKTISRRDRPNLPRPSWKIRVTQLECFEAVKRRFAWNARLNEKTTADADESVLAPMGCLQYYPDRAGTFESFNYNGGSGPYLGNLFYAVCFKKSSGICGLRLTASHFEVAYYASDIGQTDADCHAGRDRGDYIFLPEARTADGVEASKWCGTSLQGRVTAVTPPGPLYVHFKSDDLTTQNVNEYGYRFDYNTLNNCDA